MRKDIIIIDDDRDLCTLLQESLLQENICADISCNGFDGIKSVKDKEYQLVVLDVMMPGISGFEVLERIRDMSNVPILMLTAKDDSTSKVKGLRAGADDYLTKPFEMEEFFARVLPIIIVCAFAEGKSLLGVAVAFIYGYFATMEGSMLNWFPIKAAMILVDPKCGSEYGITYKIPPAAMSIIGVLVVSILLFQMLNRTKKNVYMKSKRKVKVKQTRRKGW